MANDLAASSIRRALRMVRAELEYLSDTSAITSEELNAIYSQLDKADARAGVNRQQQQQPSPLPPPVSSPLPQTVPSQPSPVHYTPPTTQMANTSLNEKLPPYNQYVAPPPAPPPAYPQAPPVLSHATALYAYTPTDRDDLALLPNDRVQVLERINDDWWRGRNERTGMEGIFPRSYVNEIGEKGPVYSPPPTNYGNVPLEVSQSGSSANAPSDPAQKSKFEQGGKKFGKKFGNAAIFGAGATVGSSIVNGIL